MRRAILFIICICMVIALLLGCSGIQDSQGIAFETPEQTTAAYVENLATQEANQTNSDSDEANEDAVLVDNDYFTATYIGAQDQADLGVFYVTLRIENKTDVDVFVSVEDADVDGETVQMVMTGVPLVVRPGNSGQTGFIFPMGNLSISSMSEAEKATFRIVIRNNDTFDIVAESELVAVDLTK